MAELRMSEEQATLESYRRMDIRDANRDLEWGRKAAHKPMNVPVWVKTANGNKMPAYKMSEADIQRAITRLMIGSHVGRCGALPTD